MGGWTRAPRLAAAAAAFAFLAAGCSSPGTPVSAVSPSKAGFSRSITPHASPSDSARPTATPKPKLTDPFKGASLASFLASRQGVVTAALYDKSTNQLWEYNKGTHEYTASIVKVQIMGTLLQRAQNGQPLSATEQSQLTAMIEASDNTAASNLLADVGGPAGVLKFDQSAGLTSTAPHDTSPPIPGTPWPAWGLTTTTARDQVVLVKRFAYNNQVLSRPSRVRGMALMKSVEAGQNWGVSAGVLPGTTVALKNGWIQFPVALPYASKPGGWQIDSIGWIKGNGRNYVLAVLTANNPDEQYGIATIEGISRQVFAALGASAG